MTQPEIVGNQLIELKLTGIRETYASRLKFARQQKLSHEELISTLFQDEIDFRRTARIDRLLKRAAFKQKASLETFDLSIPRGVDKSHLTDFAGGRFLVDGTNILLLGPTDLVT